MKQDKRMISLKLKHEKPSILKQDNQANETAPSTSNIAAFKPNKVTDVHSSWAEVSNWFSLQNKLTNDNNLPDLKYACKQLYQSLSVICIIW